jgi:formylglycine-generating enzyme required for sulfatase activity
VAYAYSIGKYEVTAGQYCAFLTAKAATDTYGLYNTNMDTAVSSYGCNIKRTGSSGSYAYTVASDWANRPVNYVSWGDSVRFANWLTNGQGNGSTETGAYSLNGAMTNAELMAVVVPSQAKRTTWSNGAKPYFLLTSENEWYKAAYYDPAKTGGAGYWDYPTSSNTAPGQDMADVSGNNANYYTGSGIYPIDSGKYTTVVGQFQKSESPYGTFDQGGNVWEWNEAILYGSSRGVRGGSFHSQDDGYALRASYRSYVNAPPYEYNLIGFRVSEVPEPATLSLLALGGLTMLRRRKSGLIDKFCRACNYCCTRNLGWHNHCASYK